jgi:hypothetical protein
VDPVPVSLLLRKSGSARNRTRDLLANSQKLWLPDHRGGLHIMLCETPKNLLICQHFVANFASEMNCIPRTGFTHTTPPAPLHPQGVEQCDHCWAACRSFWFELTTEMWALMQDKLKCNRFVMPYYHPAPPPPPSADRGAQNTCQVFRALGRH